MKTVMRVVAAFFLVSGIQGGGAQAQTQTKFQLITSSSSGSASTVQTPQRQPMPGYCAPMTMNMCGAQLRIDPSAVGAITTIQMPEQFVARSFLVQCVDGRSGPYYSVLQATEALCTLKTCKAGSNLTVCGAPVAVSKEAKVGEEVKIDVPPSMLAESRKSSTTAFTARCNLNDGGAVYELSSTSGLSCNDFACEPATLRLCRDAVQVRKPSELGEVLDLMSDRGQRVKVECIASSGNRPAYVITDGGADACH